MSGPVDLPDDDGDVLCAYPTCAQRTSALFCQTHRALLCTLDDAASHERMPSDRSSRGAEEAHA